MAVAVLCSVREVVLSIRVHFAIVLFQVVSPEEVDYEGDDDNNDDNNQQDDVGYIRWEFIWFGFLTQSHRLVI